MPLSNAPLCTSECRRLRYSKVLLVYIPSKSRYWQGIALYCIAAVVMEYQPVLLCCKMPCWVVEYWTVHMLARGVGILASTGNVQYSICSAWTSYTADSNQTRAVMQVSITAGYLPVQRIIHSCFSCSLECGRHGLTFFLQMFWRKIF